MARKTVNKDAANKVRGTQKYDAGDIICFNKKYPVLFFCPIPNSHEELIFDSFSKDADGLAIELKLHLSVEYLIMEKIDANPDTDKSPKKRIYYEETSGTDIYIPPYSYLYMYCKDEISRQLYRDRESHKTSSDQKEWLIEFNLPDEWELSFQLISILRKKEDDRVNFGKDGDKRYFDNYTKQGVYENPSKDKKSYFLVSENITSYPKNTKNTGFPIEAILMLPGALFKKFE